MTSGIKTDKMPLDWQLGVTGGLGTVSMEELGLKWGCTGLRVGGEEVETRLMDYCLAVWEQGTRKGKEGNPDKEKESVKMKRGRRRDI